MLNGWNYFDTGDALMALAISIFTVLVVVIYTKNANKEGKK